MRDEPTGVRPSVLAIAAVLVLGCAFAIYEAFRFDPIAVTTIAEPAPASRHASRYGRDPLFAADASLTQR